LARTHFGDVGTVGGVGWMRAACRRGRSMYGGGWMARERKRRMGTVGAVETDAGGWCKETCGTRD